MTDQPTPPSGFLLIDKAADWTSHDVVGYIRARVRKATGIKRIRVGHAGTLDPFATGLLIVGVGREATRRMDEFVGMPKEYVAEIQLGATSDTHDKTGEITKTPDTTPVTKDAIETMLKTFLGPQEQIPPMHSAKKIGGKKLYELAREGKEVERQPSQIEIYDLELTSFDKNTQTLTIRCQVSKGTYIRTLAFDIGQALGTGAYCQELRRTKIGKYSVDNAVPVESITEFSWQDLLFG